MDFGCSDQSLPRALHCQTPTHERHTMSPTRTLPLFATALLALSACHEGNTSASGPSTTGTRPPEALHIGMIDNAGYRYQDGAGCAFMRGDMPFDYEDQSTWQHPFLSSWNTDPETGWVNVDGEILDVTVVQFDDDGASDADAIALHYENPNFSLIVRIEGRINDAIDNEGGTIEGQLRVERDGHSASLPVTGYCGS